MARCALEGGCPSDFVAVAISILSFFVLLWKATFPFIVHKDPHPTGSSFWIPVIQDFASFNLLLSIMMPFNFLKFNKRHWWQSCYLWSGPLGFGLLLTCRITQAYQLYFIFVKRWLPAIRSNVFFPLFLLPWLAVATFVHMNKLLNHQCHLQIHWMVPVLCLHAMYVAILVGFTGAIRHVEFRFDELRDLLRGIAMSALSIGLWVTSYVLNETHDDILWLQVASRFMLLVSGSILVLASFSISSSQPLLSQISLRKKEPGELRIMGQALGISDSGIQAQSEPASVIDPNEPLDKLLLKKQFRRSFMAFADSCLAGESVHFFDEVLEIEKIP